MSAPQPARLPMIAPVELRGHRLFERLEAGDRTALLALAKPSAADRGTLLFREGESCDGFYFVLAGIVRLYKVSPEGREHVVEVIRVGQSFAEAAVFSDMPFPVHAEPLEPSRLLFFPKEPFLAYLREHPHCLFGMIASLSVRMHQLITKVEALTLRDAGQRVAGFLSRNGAARGGNLDLSRHTMAAHLGLTPETLSRTLAALQTQGVIVLEGRQFSIADADTLGALSRGEVHLG
ncbi:MAG: Crp/Fnr family transcriptional regulator [Nitrospirota bacterium]|nr:Crp/Fnr family transcriptional regulator [Nitrospirota bacterium]